MLQSTAAHAGHLTGHRRLENRESNTVALCAGHGGLPFLSSTRCSSAWWPFASPCPSSRRCLCARSDRERFRADEVERVSEIRPVAWTPRSRSGLAARRPCGGHQPWWPASGSAPVVAGAGTRARTRRGPSLRRAPAGAGTAPPRDGPKEGTASQAQSYTGSDVAVRTGTGSAFRRPTERGGRVSMKDVRHCGDEFRGRTEGMAGRGRGDRGPLLPKKASGDATHRETWRLTAAVASRRGQPAGARRALNSAGVATSSPTPATPTGYPLARGPTGA